MCLSVGDHTLYHVPHWWIWSNHIIPLLFFWKMLYLNLRKDCQRYCWRYVCMSLLRLYLLNMMMNLQMFFMMLIFQRFFLMKLPYYLFSQRFFWVKIIHIFYWMKFLHYFHQIMTFWMIVFIYLNHSFKGHLWYWSFNYFFRWWRWSWLWPF